MNVLFYLPDSTLRRCFRPHDLRRLAQKHRLLLPPAHRRTSRRSAFEEYAATGRIAPAHPEMKSCQDLLTKHAPVAEVLVTGWGTPPLTPALLQRIPKLKLIVHAAGSIRSLVPLAAWEHGVRVATCNDALAIGVAETTLGMIIAGLKGFFPARAWTRAGHWHDARLGTDQTVVRELFGVTIGIISASKVGLHVMRLLKHFAVETLLYDPFATPQQAREWGVRLVTLKTLMKRSDVVSLHAPLLPATRHLLRREHFRSLKDQAIFINTARGAIVDEPALLAELKTGRIFAFIDVTDPEPPAQRHALRTLPNVVLTPHLAGAVSNGCFRLGCSAVEQILEFAATGELSGEVTAEMLKIMA